MAAAEREPRVVLYRRVSTGDQGLGLDAQAERLRAEAERRGWRDPEWVTDEGVSGSIDAADRRELGPTLARLLGGDVLAFAKLDRLSRSLHDFAGMIRRSRDEGWDLVCLDPPLDLTTPAGRAMAGVLVVFAEYEREMIGQRTREGLAQSGKRLGRPPGLPATGGGRPAPVPAGTAAVVRDALAEGLSPARVAERLNDYGVPSLRGGRWHRESVRRLVARLDTDKV
jgi:DNA invertase Pin-like site-specific DNA recombinase